MVLNPAGHMVWDVWHEIPVKFPTVLPDAFTVMPNHIHGVLWLTEPERTGGDAPNDRTDEALPKAHSPSLPEIIQWFKSLTTARYRHGVVEQGWPPFPGKLWQRSYYDHIVRRDEALNRIRQYIRDNPQRWSMDRYNPESVGPDPWAIEIWHMLQAP
ncbi:MAG: hypothetical protein KatS3mg050_0222 [Litorilinea sp.]|nr:MAG: hypothetical protein KatS3mg050_0222 [Litorilinea sp.]